MRTWNDLYKMLKNGEMDRSLMQTGSLYSETEKSARVVRIRNLKKQTDSMHICGKSTINRFVGR